MKEDQITFRDTGVFFRTYGDEDQPAVVLIHGYLESSEIWDSFARRLAGKFHIVVPDLPGHGKSGVYGSVHSMESLAEAVAAVMRHLGISKFHLIGHSMGGYVTMAFREAFPEMLLSYVLFHSTCFADTDEKKASRSREIALVRQGKRQLLVNTNIPKEFADDNHERLKDEIDRAKRIASDSPGDGIIALLNGMMERPDRCRLLSEDKVPLLILGGKKDNYIPFLKLEEMVSMGTNVKLLGLENSGHMGFVEEPGVAAAGLERFFSHFR